MFWLVDLLLYKNQLRVERGPARATGGRRNCGKIHIFLPKSIKERKDGDDDGGNNLYIRHGRKITTSPETIKLMLDKSGTENGVGEKREREIA